MCGVFCALAVVLLGIGAIAEIADITAAAFSALLLLPILLCYGEKYAWLSYAVTATLGLVLMPQSLGSWMFALLTGFYPIIRGRLQRLPRILGWIFKLLLLAVVLAIYFVAFYFLMLGGEGSLTDAFLKCFGDAGGAPILSFLFIGLMVATYLLFDFLIDRLLVLYYLKWQKRVERWMKP